jgi:hypothetical protein
VIFLPSTVVAFERAALDHHLGDAPGLHLVEELGVLERVLRHLAGIELVEDRHQHDADHQPDGEILEGSSISLSLNTARERQPPALGLLHVGVGDVLHHPGLAGSCCASDCRSWTLPVTVTMSAMIELHSPTDCRRELRAEAHHLKPGRQHQQEWTYANRC